MSHRVSGRRDEWRPPRRAADPTAASVPTRRWSVLGVIGAAQLMVVLDITIVNIALPSAQDELGFDVASRQWVITAYSLAFGSLLLLGGRLSDRVGVRRTLIIGLLGFAAASAVGGAADGFAMLIAARAGQGVFAAILAPAALSTLNITFTEPEDRARAFAVFSAIAASGAVVGLLVGGAVTEWLSWRWCLYINLALALPAAVGAFFIVRAAPRQRRAGLDWPGAVSASGGLFCLVYGLSTAESDGWTAPITVVLLTASAVLIMAFVVIETRVQAPLLPLQIVADRNRGGAYLTIAVTFCAMFAAFLFLTYFMQRDLVYSPLATGVAFLPMAAGIGLAAALANTVLMRRVGPRPIIPTGMVVAAAGMAWLGGLTVDATYIRDILGPSILLGLGMGMAFSPAVATATSGVATEDAGVASAMVNTSQQIGGTVGTAALSTIFTTVLDRYIHNHRPPTPAVAATGAIHGYTVAFHIASGLFLVGAILTGIILRSGRLINNDPIHI
ncbi:MFS transporter [Mycobacterium sp. 29Ha]|uniref:MFS transporter n=1 Tax=Mycobacterium sp. 29Ha TaxID=2939268 RepID=UPI0029391D30|nr:MFS transporter [Mycobacterium sp. 29Ha]MDV3131318.1 MFS transporter [Mycobacterium sp. 29Ha]